jgi:hypothetical protein
MAAGKDRHEIMLLCDHIIFWFENEQQPTFENAFEMSMYEIQCAAAYFAERFTALIAAMPAVSKALNQMAAAINKYAEELK